MNSGDGGYCAINWADPEQVLTFVNGRVFRSETGGTSESAWSAAWNFPWATMTQPIVTTPFNPSNPADADIVAVGAGSSVYVSFDFAQSWLTSGVIHACGSENARLAPAAEPDFIGTTGGRVFRGDRTLVMDRRALDDDGRAASPLRIDY